MVLYFSYDFNSWQTIALLTKIGQSMGCIFIKVLSATGAKCSYNVECTFKVRITVWSKKQYFSELS